MTQLLVEEFVTTGMGWRRKNLSKSDNSRKSYRNHLNQFEKFLAKIGKTIHTVHDADIEQYIVNMKRKYQPNTVAVKTAAINSYFKWMEHKGAITRMPSIKHQPHVVGVHKRIPDEALNAVFGTIEGDTLKETRDTAMISLIAFLGFKTEVVVALNVGDDICLPQTNDKSIMLVHHALQRYSAKRNENGLSTEPDAPFFVNKHKERISGRSLRRHLCKCFVDAKIAETYSTRDLQYTYQCKNPKSVS